MQPLVRDRFIRRASELYEKPDSSLWGGLPGTEPPTAENCAVTNDSIHADEINEIPLDNYSPYPSNTVHERAQSGGKTTATFGMSQRVSIGSQPEAKRNSIANLQKYGAILKDR